MSNYENNIILEIRNQINDFMKENWFYILLFLITIHWFKDFTTMVLLIMFSSFIPESKLFLTLLMFYTCIPYIINEFLMFSRYDNGKDFVSCDQLNANPGDIIEFRRLSFEIPALYIKIITYSHWGIYAGNGMTIHFVNLYKKLGIVRYEPLESVANGSLCRLVRYYIFQ